MPTTGRVAPTRPSRARRSPRPTGDDREAAILATAERLLADRPFADISVDDLARGAGLSRPTFYFYFPSKDAVLLALLERVAVAADTALARLVTHPPADRVALWRTGIRNFVDTFGAHRNVSVAANLARVNTEIDELWSTFMSRWVEHITMVIEAERARGAAPVTIPARDLSAALNQLNEKVMLSSWAGDRPSVSADRIVDTLVHVWTASVYHEGR